MKKPVQSDVVNDEIAKLAKRLGRKNLTFLETGSIRSGEEPHRIGDGWSTLTFATYVKANGGRSTSVDLDTSPAARVLVREEVAGYATLVQSDSLAYMDNLVATDQSFDLILLDSASDADHILNEWQRAVELVKSPATILLDDVQHDDDTCGTKGARVIEKLNESGMTFRRLKRWSGFAWIGMIAIDF